MGAKVYGYGAVRCTSMGWLSGRVYVYGIQGVRLWDVRCTFVGAQVYIYGEQSRLGLKGVRLWGAARAIAPWRRGQACALTHGGGLRPAFAITFLGPWMG